MIELDDDGALTAVKENGPDDSATIVASRAALANALASCTSVDAAVTGADSPPAARTSTSKPPPLPPKASLAPKPASGASSLPVQPPSSVTLGRDEVRALVRAAQGTLGELDHMLREIQRRLEDPSKWPTAPGEASAPLTYRTQPAATASPQALPAARDPGLDAPSSDKKIRPRVVYAAVSLAVGFGALVLALVCIQSC